MGVFAMQTLYVEPGGLPPFWDHRDFYQTSVILPDGRVLFSSERKDGLRLLRAFQRTNKLKLLICYLVVYLYSSRLEGFFIWMQKDCNCLNVGLCRNLETNRSLQMDINLLKTVLFVVILDLLLLMFEQSLC